MLAPITPYPKRINLYLDTEFTGLHQRTDLISLSLVHSRTCYFYAEFVSFSRAQLDEWLNTNVMANCIFLKEHGFCRPPEEIPLSPDCPIRELGPGYIFDRDINTKMIRMRGWPENILANLDVWLKHVEFKFVTKDHDQVVPFQVISDCFSYDWVLFNELYGGARRLPSTISYIPIDICSLFFANNIDPDISRVGFAGDAAVTDLPQHNALADAFNIKACFERLQAMKKSS